MPKLPSFAFYPGDWLRNDVAGCSLEAQGLWLRMMMVMHDAEVYGELSINGDPMPDEFVAKKCGISRKIYQKYLKELSTFSVINRKENGVIYSGRMVKDEAKRQQNAKRQRDFYDRHKDEPNAKPNASSSSSSSISVSKGTEKKKSTPQAASPKKGTRIPEPFYLTSEMKEWAAREKPGVDLAIETKKFCNYFRAKTGRDATKLDWRATWENWILNARDSPQLAKVERFEPGRNDAPVEQETETICGVCGKEYCLKTHIREAA